MKTVRLIIISAALAGAALLAVSCTTAPRMNLDSYRKAMARTAQGQPTLPKGSGIERAALAAFSDFYADFTPEGIRRRTREVYADNAFFADPFHTVEGIDAVEEYFIRSTETFQSCTFSIDDVAVTANGDVYLRWTMNLVLKRGSGEPIEGIGMTHARFDASGKVVFHQDYWDAGTTVYEHLPVIGRTLRWIRSRV